MHEFNSKVKHSNAGFATTKDVLTAFWRGMSHYKFSLILALFGVVMARIFAIIIPTYYRKFFDILSIPISLGERADKLFHIIILIFCFNLLVWIGYRMGSFAIIYFQSKVIARLKQNAFEYMIEHSYTFYSNNFTGSLVQKVNRFARAFETLADRVLFDVVPLFIQITGVCLVLWFTNPIITVVLIVWISIFLLFNYLFSIWKLKYDVKRASMDSFATGVLSDAVSNQNTIQLFAGSRFESKYFREVTNEQANLTKFVSNLQSAVNAVLSFLILVIEFLLFYFAIKYWQAGSITVGTFVLIQVYFVSLSGYLWDFSRVIGSIYEAVADAKEMVDILLLGQDIKNTKGAKMLKISKGQVTFSDVRFRFNENASVIKDFNLSINSGEKVAIIGPSGAGKSTFVKLLLRLYDVSSGAILVDGQDIKEITQESLRENISLVPQDPILFHRTLLENIRYGRRNATDKEALKAASLAHCDEFALNLPAKYNTYVGERGIKLSGGERQRVAIARAILKNAPILVLDEATSSLDSHSESLIQDALDKLMKNKTVIVIAHRLSTIRKMDRIIVLEKGKVVEEGSHDELLKNNSSLYTKLWNLQAGGFIQADALNE